MLFGLKGIQVPHRKHTAGMSPQKMPTPERVTIPTVMHIGAPAQVVVKKGDKVCKGSLIASAAEGLSANIHSSVSGEVECVEDFLLSNGKKVPAVVIKSDGLDTVDSGIKAPVIGSREDLINAIKESGAVGLGGAGFPTYAKLTADCPIDELVINGAECEPYITSDSVTMTDFTEDIEDCFDMLLKYLTIGKIVIGIENNKPQAISAMRAVAEKNSQVEVKVLPDIYPQGGEKVLIYHTTGKVVPQGKLPLEVGCVVMNSTTCAFLGKFFKTGMPLVEKCVTVDGGAVNIPQNVFAPIGAAVGDVFDFCGGFSSQPAKVIYGGPMMGISVPDMTAPILKNTNAILAFNEVEAIQPKTTACIRCGRCINSCPFGIAPPAIAKAYKNADAEALKKVGTTLCMECGCCSFVCPANRPLVENNRLAKQFLAEQIKKEAK